MCNCELCGDEIKQDAMVSACNLSNDDTMIYYSNVCGKCASIIRQTIFNLKNINNSGYLESDELNKAIKLKYSLAKKCEK